jgi:hypothetical protein
MKKRLGREGLQDLVNTFRWPAAIVVLFVAALCAAPSQSHAYGHAPDDPGTAGAAGFDRPHLP